MKSATLGLAVCFAAGISGATWAQDLKATPRFSETQIGFDPGASYGNYTLTVTGPNGFHATTSSGTGTPTVDLRRVGPFDDGMYHYNLTASADEKVAVRTALDNGRGGGPANAMLKDVAMSGVFHVKGGTIVKFDTAAREPAARQK